MLYNIFSKKYLCYITLFYNIKISVYTTNKRIATTSKLKSKKTKRVLKDEKNVTCL